MALAALAVVLYLFWPLLGELRAAAELIKTARWTWLLIAVLIQSASYTSLTWLNSLALHPFTGHIHFGRLAALLTSMAFIEVAVPSAGASGVALRARLLGKHGYSVGASTFTLVLETVYLGIAMTTVALLGVAYLLRQGELSAAQMAALGAAALAAATAVWGAWRLVPDKVRSRKLLAGFVRVWNRIAGMRLGLGFKALEARLTGFQSSLEALRTMPSCKFVLAAYGRVILDVASMGACFAVFGYPTNPGVLLTGYGLLLLLSGLAALPGGLGMADASLPVIFNRLGVPGSVALVAGLSYRLLAFWCVRFVGFASWEILESRS